MKVEVGIEVWVKRILRFLNYVEVMNYSINCIDCRAFVWEMFCAWVWMLFWVELEYWTWVVNEAVYCCTMNERPPRLYFCDVLGFVIMTLETFLMDRVAFLIIIEKKVL